MLDAVAELAEHARTGRSLRRLGDEEHADALGADEPHGALDADRRNASVASSKSRCASSRKTTSLGLGRSPASGSVSNSSATQPHQRGGPQRRAGPAPRRARRSEMTPRPSGAIRMQVGHVELRLAEELGAAARLEPDQRAQQHADGRRRQPADALELALAGVGVQEGQQRAQVGEVERAAGPFVVGVVEDELRATAPASRWRRAPWRAAAARSPRRVARIGTPGPIPPSEQELDREARSGPNGTPELASRASAAFAAGIARRGQAATRRP